MHKIKHTYILDNPFEDPPQLAELIPENSPLGNAHDEAIWVMPFMYAELIIELFSQCNMMPSCLSMWICHTVFPVANTQVAEEHLEDSWVPLDETVDPDQLKPL